MAAHQRGADARPAAGANGSAQIVVFVAPSAAARLARAAQSIAAGPPHAERLLVAPTRAAAEDLARELVSRSGASVGLRCASFVELVAKLAAPALAARGLVPATASGLDAVTARTIARAVAERRLSYLAPIASRPGFRRALARTLVEARLEGVPPASFAAAPRTGPDLMHFAATFAEEVHAARVADYATLLQLAIEALAGGAALVAGRPVALLDVPVGSRLEMAVVTALAAAARSVLVTVPAGDERSERMLAESGIAAFEPTTHDAAPAALALAQRLLFGARETGEPTAECSLDQGVELFSAPGEGRESVEIARRILHEARRGVPFDRMAILVRAPSAYAGLLETALARAGIPAWMARGVRRPDPAGRAFLALLRMADEGLSARRFAEYVSFGQVPAAPGTSDWHGPDDETVRATIDARSETDGNEGLEPASPSHTSAEDHQALTGPGRAPWTWERLLNEASVIGGLDRWRRRLSGLACELTLGIEELAREEPEAPRIRAFERDLRELHELRRFALPIIERLAAWPSEATWGEWVALFEAIAPEVLATPDRVLTVLANLRALDRLGPVPLVEIMDVLADRLSEVSEPPRGTRFGKVFVATPDAARGRAFDVVFVPGLAERVFPERTRQDPLLLDGARLLVASGLRVDADRLADERLRLRLAVGAARQRVHLSYSSLELTSARDRVPSFYALDVARAVTGRIPDHHALARHAARASGARLAWPAPPEPADAIDSAEHDLATLRRLLSDPAAARRGGARYLLQLHPALARSLRTRYARWRAEWSGYDGVVLDATARALLASHRLSARPYSPSALQRFSTCPYQFYLSSILRLEPRAAAVAVHRLDPLTRGRLMHEVLAGFIRACLSSGLSWREESLDDARAQLDRAIDEVAARYRDELAPPVERVWLEEIAAIRADLRGWIEQAVRAAGDWQPAFVELGLGFGPGDGRDPASRVAPIVIADRWQVHGIVDLVERHRGTGALRVTDFKTGRSSGTSRLVVGGGAMLQPALYGTAVETALGRPVIESRLWFCTAAGRYDQRPVRLTPDVDGARRTLVEVLEIIDRAIEHGFLPAAPGTGACERCDFRTVCGLHEARRVERKDRRRLADLDALRDMR